MDCSCSLSLSLGLDLGIFCLTGTRWGEWGVGQRDKRRRKYLEEMEMGEETRKGEKRGKREEDAGEKREEKRVCRREEERRDARVSRRGSLGCPTGGRSEKKKESGGRLSS